MTVNSVSMKRVNERNGKPKHKNGKMSVDVIEVVVLFLTGKISHKKNDRMNTKACCQIDKYYIEIKIRRRNVSPRFC